MRERLRRRVRVARVPLLRLTVMAYNPRRPAVDMLSAEGWDRRRATQPGFAFPGTRDEWIAAAEADEDLGGRAAAIAAVARSLGAATVCSYGAGTGMLEWRLHQASPGLEITCTDFAPRTVARLRRVFPEAHVVQHDLAADEPLHADIALLHRIDTELSDDAWRQVFGRLGVCLVVVSDFLRFGQLAHSRRGHGEPTGWLRTPRATTALWRDSHQHKRLPVGDLDGFLLWPRRVAAPGRRITVRASRARKHP